MRIRSESLISHPIDVVFGAYRDRLPEMVSYLPDVQEIVVVKREDKGERVRLHNEWIADRDVPTFARSFIKPEMLRWDDFAEWHETELRCRWMLRLRVFSDAFSCSGTTSFRVDGSGTRVMLDGELNLDLNKIRGIPKLMARTMGSKVESFVVGLITPNLERTNVALQSFLDDLG